jgi:hypothetical protein
MRYADQRLLELGAPRRPPGRTKYPPGTAEKPCTQCGVVKTLDAYMPLKHGALGRHSVCNECRRLIAKEYTKAKREGAAGRLRPDMCDCCGQPPQRRALYWDHDHATDQFRGWLCHHCNTALGSVNDDQEKLLLLIQYLRRGGGPA